MSFFVASDKLWRKDPQGHHKLVAVPLARVALMRAAHDGIGHKGVYATTELISERFWWPAMQSDIAWFVRTSRLCQLRQTRNVLIPLTVVTPAPIFSKIYIDTMHLPKSGGFKYIVQGCCSLIHYVKFRMLRNETAISLGDWIFEDIICHWGTLSEIVSDNGDRYSSDSSLRHRRSYLLASASRLHPIHYRVNRESCDSSSEAPSTPC
jgi:hypothetical protein